MDVRYGRNDPRKVRPTRQDQVAYACTVEEMPAHPQVTGPDAVRRTLAACRVAKLFAYAVPDFASLPPEARSLPVKVVAQPGVEVGPYVRDPTLVAAILGYQGTITFDVGSAAKPDRYYPIVLFLLRSLHEQHPEVGLAVRAESLVVGFAPTRLIAGLQGLFLQFSGAGNCMPVDLGLGAVEASERSLDDTMRFGWCLGPLRTRLNSEALITLEGQVDGLAAEDLLHPLAGSVVRIGGHEVYVGAGGKCVFLSSGHLGFCRQHSDGRYDLAQLSHQGWTPAIPIENVVSMGCAADLHLQGSFRHFYGYKEPVWADASSVASAEPATSLDHVWQSGRHMIFRDDDD